ncbi:alkaline phosphatase family protein [Balneolaceae bacterium YR4-1]|uniref:Alkaline phosphatase family protein n=1 Tax=Halalkalibaculum roseum TaxID=2709311 RepID=A0A6M1SQD1_9BACT|nr:ectonucleotide pyrophosphatase/phosphodiesterase [Halalkalibaculum roseum]NGP77571.1 alkaline phosphatase family protein [Halalkalibaculum roseum]
MKSYRKLYTTLFVLFLIGAIGCTESNTSNDRALTPENQLLLISFDGFRYDYLNRVSTPHFDSLVANGVKSEGLIPVFPTKTFPNHYSIVTGLYTENTGLIDNTMYDPEFEEWYRIRDREAVENKKWYGGEPIWNTAEKQGLRAGTMFWVGSEAPVQNMRPTFWKPFDGGMSYTARVDTVVKWLTYTDDKAVDFATLYFELVDSKGHNHGLQSDSLDLAIQRADSLLGYLKENLRRANNWSNMNVIVVSDHGMVDLSAEKTIMLDSIINLDDVERIRWAPATMIQPKEGKTDEIYRLLKENEENYRVYRKDELPERYHLKNNRRVPDIVMVADLGYTILNEGYKERFMNNLPAATHGYDNRAKAMHALFVAKGPAFKSGVTIPEFSNIHIYELMNHLLGTNPAPNDGTLDSVKVMLK